MDDVREATLDLTPDELQSLLERAAALAEREIEAARVGPVFAAAPEAGSAVSDADRDLPLEGDDLDSLLERCAQVLAAGRRSAPTFFGYVFSPAAPVGVAADLLASAADQNVTSWRSAPAATELEHLSIRWLAQLVGYPAETGGLLVSGGSMANLAALFLALRNCAPADADRRRLVAYMSQEAHFSLAKAAAVIGVEARAIGTDATTRLDVRLLREELARDRATGRQPFCVIGSAGTTATGAIDPLDELAALAAQEELWFHVDGAYGGFAAADPATRPRFAGLEHADSVALDAHKWLYVPVDCGALLVRDPATSVRAFAATASDYVKTLADQETEAFAFWDHGLELSRRFRALKVWMTLRYYGARRIAAAIAEDMALAAHLADLVRVAEDLELLAEPSLSICCFRHAPPGMPPAELDAHNERLLAALQRDGRAYLSNATVGGRFALRACITNFRTTRADVVRTLEIVRELGARAAG